MGIIDKFENKEPYHTIDCIQLDATFEKFHRNYDQNPLFNGKKLSDFNFNILKNEFIIHKKILKMIVIEVQPKDILKKIN